MKTIGVRELRQNASRYLAEVEAGAEIAVTRRGRTVARMVPVSEGERTRESLIDAGILVPARRAGVLDPGVLDAVLDDDLTVADLSGVLNELRADR
ncbi:type II toxin-antitoxin system Phd/YefM family antitoxin [Tomitella cavernea]|uniref:Antitoxin n=1 Tax=Tomitella cavernea TaxID=1387982 RepID=A0ABP9CG20_9ACTN|nr:type II toxin-antitoxin system prevent-host-death family antitoxin [Tomitella cavernea]